VASLNQTLHLIALAYPKGYKLKLQQQLVGCTASGDLERRDGGQTWESSTRTPTNVYVRG
jgi:hypothetical protein